MPTIVTPPATEQVLAGQPAPDLRGWRRHRANGRAWLERQPVWLFTLVIAAVSRLLVIILTLPAALITHLARVSDSTVVGPPIFTSESDLAILLALLVWAPLVETLISQSLVIGILTRISRRVDVQIAVSALLFGALHWPKPLQMTMAIVPGLALGYAYAFWRGRSRHSSYWAAALTHFWVNGLGVALGLLLGVGFRQ